MRLTKRQHAQLLGAWGALAWGAAAVLHQSPLLAYGATVAGYSALGFHASCRGLCYVVGFEDDSAIDRCCVASALLLAAYVLKVPAVGQRWSALRFEGRASAGNDQGAVLLVFVLFDDTWDVVW